MIGNAVQVMKIATGEIEEELPDAGKDYARKGGLKVVRRALTVCPRNGALRSRRKRACAMKKALVSTVLSGLAISQANAEFYTYFAWSQMSQSQKNGYIAGIIDSYLTFSVSYRSAADHFSSCIIRLELTDGQLATGIGAFAASGPAEQGRPMPSVVLGYLIELCGPAPNSN